MDEFIKLLDPDLHYPRHGITDKELLIYVESERLEVKCTYCGQLSSRCHSVYERSFQDLPMMGKKTKIILKNRKMFCQNPDCNHTTFAEPFSFLAPKGKKTRRLIDKIMDISLNTSSVSAAKTLRDGIADVWKSTMILSRLVDTFFTRILYPMLPLSRNHSIAVV